MDDDDLVEKVDSFLRLCEERRLEEAAAHLTPDAIMVFPGETRFHTLAEMVAAAGPRYRELRKQRTDYWVGTRVSDGSRTVVSRGTLHGVGADGRRFDAVRYTDLFVFRGGLIAEQHVFNDLAELGVVRPGGEH